MLSVIKITNAFILKDNFDQNMYMFQIAQGIFRKINLRTPDGAKLNLI
jgi:hypothetical protein